MSEVHNGKMFMHLSSSSYELHHACSAISYMSPIVISSKNGLDYGLVTSVVCGPMHDGPVATWHARSRDDPDRAAL